MGNDESVIFLAGWVDDLLVVWLEGRRAEPGDNRLSTGPSENMSVPNVRRDAVDIVGVDEGRREWPPQSPSEKSFMARAPPDPAPELGSGGFCRPLGQEKSTWRCGVRDPERGTELVMGCEESLGNSRQEEDVKKF